MTESNAAEADIKELEERLKAKMRAQIKRVSRVLYFAAFLAAVFLAALQSLFAFGPSAVIFAAPMIVYVLCAAAFLRKRRWIAALACLFAAVALSTVFPRAKMLAIRSRARHEFYKP